MVNNDLCSVCGASWRCEHAEPLPVTAHLEEYGLPVDYYRAPKETPRVSEFKPDRAVCPAAFTTLRSCALKLRRRSRPRWTR